MASFDASVAAQDSRIVCSVWVATIIFLVYDWSLTLAKESYHIWTRAQWTIRFLYASCRYGSMASLLVACVCALGRIEVHQEVHLLLLLDCLHLYVQLRFSRNGVDPAHQRVVQL
ncbi:hypothetical protein PsYK624_049300 [Phanerochaete sordida]|uniref:DUF6533 domain-containing protein n=1 Tax=Phanerochaete sordida TaxID=48140 RepID=A0A9P3LC65_9APHY|nr:hypothetical protein PsYK624_049300 [Phanerochaete sordida]